MSERTQTRSCNESATCPLISNKSKQSKLLNKNNKSLMLHPPLIQAKLAISQPGDKYEQEADRVAEAVVHDDQNAGAKSISIATSPLIQRQAKKSAEKIGEAFLKTSLGREIKEKALKMGMDFVETLYGKVITGAAAVSTITLLAATNSELPMQPPEIPLDVITPGLKVKLAYEGPVQNPKAASITFIFEENVRSEEKKGMTEAEKSRAENARIAADQERFREGLKSPEQRAKEKVQFERAFWGSRNRLGLKPFDIPGLRLEDEWLQRKEADNSPSISTVPPIVHEVLSSPGQPLDSATRAFMEPRFGYDFSRVRIHTDSKAAESARAVNALAYTVGHDVVFGGGRYAPNKPDGQHLLAHELTHTIQQSRESGFIARSNETVLKSQAPDTAGTIIDRRPLPQLTTAPIILLRETNPATTNSTYKKLTEIVLWVDLNKIQVTLEDNTVDDTATLKYNGHPNPGTYTMVRRGESFRSEGQNASQIGGTPDAHGHLFHIQLRKSSIIDLQSYMLIVIGGRGQGDATSQAPIEVTITGGGKRASSRTKNENREGRSPGADKDATPTTKPKTVKSVTSQSIIATSQTAPPNNKSNDEILAEFKALPESIKDLLRGEKELKPENFEQLLRIANKLKQLKPEDLALYKLLAQKLATDLDAFELSVDFFVQFKAQIKAQANAEKTKQASNKESTLEEKLSTTWSQFDEKKFGGMDVSQKETLARDVAAQQRNIQLEHMITHPGETTVGMAESIVRVDKTAKAIAEDVQDAVDGDKGAYTRIAGAVGAYNKYIAATASIVFVALLFVPGVNLIELAAAGLAVAAATIVLSVAESELRIKAAGEAKTAEDFKTETAKSAAAQANAVVAAAMLAMTLAMKIIARIPLPGRYQNVGVALKAAQIALLDKSGIGPTWQAVKNELLGKLRSSKQGLPEALAEQSKAISETANVVEGMSGDEFVNQLTAGDPKLADLGISSDQAKAIQQISGTPEGKNIPERLRLDSLKALQDAPVEAGKKVDQFLKNVDESIENIEKTQNHEQLKSAVDDANNCLSAEEQALQATKNEQAFVKKRLETARRSGIRDQAKKELEQLRTEQAQTQAEIVRLENELSEARAKVNRLKENVNNSPRGSEARAKALEEFKAAKEELEGLLESDELGGYKEDSRKQSKKEEAILESLELKRPTLWEPTKNLVRKAAKKTSDGKFLDANTAEVINGEPVFGHIYGRENRRLILEASAKGMTQEQFTKWVNDHPEWFQLETKANNESHRFEKPGID